MARKKQKGAGAMPAMFSGSTIGVVATVLCGVSIVLTVVGMACVMRKLKRAPGLAIVPGYNLWVLGKECGLPVRHLSSFAAAFVLTCLCLVFTMLGVLGALEHGWFSEVVASPSEIAATPVLVNALCAFAALSYIACLVLAFNIMYCLATSFGHGFGYALGLLIAPFVFFPLLGFRKNEYPTRKGKNLETPELL